MARRVLPRSSKAWEADLTPGSGSATVRASLDRVCIVMMSAVGDAVHVLPVLTALKRHRPDARVSWILQPGPATLVRGHPDISEILLFERSNGWRAYNDLRRQLKERRFDLVLALQVYLKAGMITRMVRAPVKLGFDMARARDLNWVFTNAQVQPHAMQHVQDQYFEFLDAIGVPHGAPVWNLGPWPHELGQQRERLKALTLRAMGTLAAFKLEQGKFGDAIDWCEQILRRDNCWENAYRIAMRAHAEQGNRAQAMRVFERCVNTLRDELGVSPSPQTMAVHELLLRGGGV